jgi:UDP-glucose 4-epimerase
MARAVNADPETHIIPLALEVAAGKRKSFTLFGDDYPTPVPTLFITWAMATGFRTKKS